MQVEIVTQSPGRALLHVKKTSVATVNAIRRAIISQLPCFAVDEVDFYENNSAFYNEYIANRIGMVPLTFDAKAAADAKISLQVNTAGPGMVTSKDLVSSDAAIKPVNDDFPIADLADGQRLRLEAWAVRGTAKTHAKFQCATASYAYYPVFSLKKTAAAKEFLARVPKKMLGENGEVNPWHAELVEEFIERNPGNGEFSFKDDEFLFTIESYNDIPAAEHFKTALDVVKKEAAEARKQLA